jgi:hypothetical protein
MRKFYGWLGAGVFIFLFSSPSWPLESADKDVIIGSSSDNKDRSTSGDMNDNSEPQSVSDYSTDNQSDSVSSHRDKEISQGAASSGGNTPQIDNSSVGSDMNPEPPPHVILPPSTSGEQ